MCNAALETRAGNLATLQSLPFNTLKCVLQSDKLDTGDNEGNVLTCVADWAKKHESNHAHIPELLKLVRFPLLLGWIQTSNCTFLLHVVRNAIVYAQTPLVKSSRAGSLSTTLLKLRVLVDP